MARIKLAYIGGGSTRAAGTMASFIEQGEQFNGSEVVLIDLDADRLDVVADDRTEDGARRWPRSDDYVDDRSASRACETATPC